MTAGGPSATGGAPDAGAGGDISDAGGAGGASGGPTGGTGGGEQAGSGGAGGDASPPVSYTFNVLPEVASIPLAPGGVNWAGVRLVSSATEELQVTLTAQPPTGVTVTPTSETITLPPSEVVTTRFKVTGTVSTGTGLVDFLADPNVGDELSTSVTLVFSDDMARNTTSSQYPRVFASSNQSMFPPENAIDGNSSTFWVSYGSLDGEGPTEENPEWLAVDFGEAVTIGSVAVRPRVHPPPPPLVGGGRGPRDFTIQVSDDGETWTQVGDEVLDTVHDQDQLITLPEPTTSRYIRVHITRSHDPGGPGCETCYRNVQIRSFEVRPPAPEPDPDPDPSSGGAGGSGSEP